MKRMRKSECKSHALALVLMLATASAAATENPSAAYIQRTMKALEDSTAENPAHVRVMFFFGQRIYRFDQGQSSIEQRHKLLTESNQRKALVGPQAQMQITRD